MYSETITPENFLFLAIKYYSNPRMNGINDFREDLNNFRVINQTINKYLSSGEISERLLLNNIIILYNVWGPFATKMLFYRIKKEYWSQLKTALIFIDRMPQFIEVNDLIIDTVTIPLDENLITKFRKI